MNHNQILNVSNSSSESEIQKAFRKAALEIHPDHNNEPEAAEAFERLKQTRDELIEKARRAGPVHDAATIQAATDTAIRSTSSAVYSSPATIAVDQNLTPEEIEHIQKLDELAMNYASNRFKGVHSKEVKAHWRKINTVNRRIDGKY